MIEYSDAALDEAVAGLPADRVVRAPRAASGSAGPSRRDAVPPEFAAAMDDDLGTPGALAAVHDTVREGNTALDAGDRVAAANRRGGRRCAR